MSAATVRAIESGERVPFIERVNPVTRLAAIIIATTPLMLTIDWVSALVAFALEVVALAVAGANLGEVAKRSWMLAIMAPLGALGMLLYARPSGREYASFALAHITDGSITLASSVLLRVFAVALPAIALFLKVDPTRLADGLSQIAKLPSRFVLAALSGLRMVGLFVSDWRTMALARRARGLGDDFALRRFATLALALLVFALRRASRLATSMEARGFGAYPDRTWARESKLTWRDGVVVIVSIMIPVVAIAASIAAGTFNFLGTGSS